MGLINLNGNLPGSILSAKQLVKSLLSRYKPHPKNKARKMKVHSSRYSVFSFDPIDEHPITHPAASQKDSRDAIPP